MCGLCWNAINFEDKTLVVKQAYTNVNKYDLIDNIQVMHKEKIVKNVKSDSSYRTIGLESEVINLLQQYKAEQKQLAKANNKQFSETNFVFTTKNYNGITTRYLGSKFKEVVTTLKLHDYEELTLHCLRHTFCSNGICNKVTLKEMQRLLGHKNINVTADWYTHLDAKAIIQASNKATCNLLQYL